MPEYDDITSSYYDSQSDLDQIPDEVYTSQSEVIDGSTRTQGWPLVGWDNGQSYEDRERACSSPGNYRAVPINYGLDGPASRYSQFSISDLFGGKGLSDIAGEFLETLGRTNKWIGYLSEVYDVVGSIFGGRSNYGEDRATSIDAALQRCNTNSLVERLYTLFRSLSGKDYSDLTNLVGVNPNIVFYIQKMMDKINMKADSKEGCINLFHNNWSDAAIPKSCEMMHYDPTAGGLVEYNKRNNNSQRMISQWDGNSVRYSDKGFSGTDVKLYVCCRLTQKVADELNTTVKNLTSLSMGAVAGGAFIPPDMVGPKTGEIVPIYSPLTQSLGVNFSTFRAKPQARPLGTVNPTGYGRATRTIAGTLTNALFQTDVFRAIFDLMDGAGVGQETAFFSLDQLPPFDVLMSFDNEHGASCFRLLHDVEFISEDTNISVSTPVIFQTLQFVARDATPVIKMNDIDIYGTENGLSENLTETKTYTSEDQKTMDYYWGGTNNSSNTNTFPRLDAARQMGMPARTSTVTERITKIVDSDFFKKITNNPRISGTLKYEDVLKKYEDSFDVLYWRNI